MEAPAALVFGAFTLESRADGVAVATFSRPPVNAFSIAEYRALGDLIAHVEGDAAIRVLVLAAPDDARAWCGGADLRDFEGITKAARAERYAFINSVLPRFHALDRPTIAAINKAAIGLGEAEAWWFGGGSGAYVAYPDTRWGEEVAVMRIVARDEE